MPLPTVYTRDPEQAGLTHPWKKTSRTHGPDPYGTLTTGPASQGDTVMEGNVPCTALRGHGSDWRQPYPGRPQVSHLDLGRNPKESTRRETNVW